MFVRTNFGKAERKAVPAWIVSEVIEALSVIGDGCSFLFLECDGGSDRLGKRKGFGCDFKAG